MFDIFKKTHGQKGKTTAIIAAAGRSTRMGGQNKLFADICGKPVLAYSLEAFEGAAAIDAIVVVTREPDILLVSDIIKEFGITKAVSIVPGGETRQQSVAEGLKAAGQCGIAAIHDGARPCILISDIERVIAAAEKTGAAALGVPVADTLKRVNGDMNITETVDRNGLWQIQTPQAFRLEILSRAYDYAAGNGIDATDDCAVVEAVGAPVTVVEGSSSNIKITRSEDLLLAEGIIEGRWTVEGRNRF